MTDQLTEARLAALEHMVSYCVSRIMKVSQIEQDLIQIDRDREVKPPPGSLEEVEWSQSKNFYIALECILKAALELKNDSVA
jgi:hypothetical protein